MGKNVAIVGVEGSGKTALMISLGWQYRSTDKNGYYLTPDPKGGQKTLDYICEEMGKMRNGVWPMATPIDECRRLNWILGKGNSVLSEVSFVDFGGELYRAAFNEGPDVALSVKGQTWWQRFMGKPLPKDTPVESLRRQVKHCDVLVILVNLADIINDPQMLNARTREMVSIIRCMIDVMSKRIKYGVRQGRVALVFSQADNYADTFQCEGSLLNAYKKYLPFIAARHPKMPLFAVSAVNKTLPSESGFPIPAPDFGTEGFEKLMAWMALPRYPLFAPWKWLTYKTTRGWRIKRP